VSNDQLREEAASNDSSGGDFVRYALESKEGEHNDV
jgi:hypothetical protein